MPQLESAKVNYRANMPVSYRIGEDKYMKGARNVFTNQGVLETRNGISRYNSTAFTTPPDSLSFFKDNNGNGYLLAKEGSSLYKVSASSSHTAIKTGLTDGQKHRAVSFGDRHIIASGSDGLFSWDGTTFSSLGQERPSAPTVGASGSGNTLTASNYQVATTFYDSVHGFETNIGVSSSTLTVASGEQIDVSGIDSTAANAFVNKVRIYLKDITNSGDWLFWAEIDKGTTTDTIDSDPTSTATPPAKNAPPISGGAKYLAVFGSRLATAGNATYPSDVYFSEPYIPDGFDDSSTDRTINIGGEGPITGIAVGLFSDSELAPYLVAFKRNSFTIYSEVGGVSQQATSGVNGIGCVSADTIQVIDNDVIFQSTQGWHRISNGQLVGKKADKRSTKFIDGGIINDIFTREGFVYQLNMANTSNFFSVYYPTLDHYMCFVSEGASNNINKCYTYESEIGGFRPHEFQVQLNAAVLGEASSKEVVYLAGEGGYIYKYSISETQGTDIDKDGTDYPIEAFALFYWLEDDDMDASSNFGSFTVEALSQDNPVTVKYFVDWSLGEATDITYAFDNPETGFILGEAGVPRDTDGILDVNVLGDGRTTVTTSGNVFRSGQSLLLGLYKTAAGESLGFIKGQLQLNKNGNPN